MDEVKETVQDAAEKVQETAEDALEAVKEWSFELFLLQTLWTVFWEKACSTNF